MKHFCFYLLFLVILTPCLLAQKHKSDERISSASDVQDTANICLGKVASLFIHIVRDSLGHTNIPLQNIINAVDTLNQDFKPICLQFKICNIDSINNWEYDTVNITKGRDTEMVNLYNVRKAINVYVVQDFLPSNGECGFAPLATAPGPLVMDDFIFLKKSCIEGRNITISHEFGHYFGLYHTFEVAANGPELVNESNCTKKGDKICDTDAAVIACSAAVTPACIYTGALKDANGNFYMPSIGNIMSYDPEVCKTHFTNGQYERMAWVFRNYRSYIY